MKPTPIVFTNTSTIAEAYAPVPATLRIPNWYRESPEYTGGERVVRHGQTPHTVKKCIPVLDAMTAGYIIPTYVDVQVTQQDQMPRYEWPSQDALGFHPVEQAPTHPAFNGASYPKWMNPWAIKTPPGYSCLFLPPMHNPNGMFTTLPGIVDTDSYDSPVNFPFTLDDVGWTGIIPAGTPMVQVIPFKRSAFRMALGGETDLMQQAKTSALLKSLWFNSYRRNFWSRKEYR